MFKVKAYTAYYLLKYIYGYDVTITPTLKDTISVSYLIKNDYDKVFKHKNNYPKASLIINDDNIFSLITNYYGKTETHTGKLSNIIKIWNNKHFPFLG